MYIRAASQILCCKVTVFSGLWNDFEQILFYKLQLRYSRAHKWIDFEQILFYKLQPSVQIPVQSQYKNNVNTTF